LDFWFEKIPSGNPGANFAAIWPAVPKAFFQPEKKIVICVIFASQEGSPFFMSRGLLSS
jgi:hypothetical protein